MDTSIGTGWGRREGVGGDTVEHNQRAVEEVQTLGTRSLRGLFRLCTGWGVSVTTLNTHTHRKLQPRTKNTPTHTLALHSHTHSQKLWDDNTDVVGEMIIYIYIYIHSVRTQSTNKHSVTLSDRVSNFVTTKIGQPRVH